MLIINKYGQKINLEELIENGQKIVELDNLDMNQLIEIMISENINFESFLSGDDLNIEFKMNNEPLILLVLKNMGDLLAQNDGDSLVKIVMVNDEGEEIIVADMTDFTTALAATASGAETTSTPSPTPETSFDRFNEREFGNVTGENVRASDNPSPFASAADLVGELNTGLEIDSRPSNLPPIINLAQTASTIDEDNTLEIAYTTVDPDGSLASIVANAQNGEVTLNNGLITYTPNENYNGNDVISIVARDNEGLITNRNINVTINPINDAPIIDETHNIVLDETNLVDLDVGLLQVIAKNDTITQVNPFTGQPIEVPVYGFDVDTINPQIIKGLSTIGADSIKSQIENALKSLAETASGSTLPTQALQVSVSISNTEATISAKVFGLEANPFASLQVIDQVRDTILDKLGENFQLPLENATYEGNLNLIDVENDVKSIEYSNLTLEVKSTNKAFIVLVDQVKNANLDTNYLKEILTNYRKNAIVEETIEQQTVVLEGSLVASLISSGILTLDLNTDGTFVVASPLFNILGSTDNIAIKFDYVAKDDELSDSGSANITIQGINDKPIALDTNESVLLENSQTNITGGLSGAKTITRLLDLQDTLDLSDGINSVLDLDKILDSIKTTISVNTEIDSAKNTELITGIQNIILNQSAGTNFNDHDAEFLRNSSSKLKSLENDLENAFNDAFELYVTNPDATTPNAKKLEEYETSFKQIFLDGTPSTTFNDADLTSALTTYILSSQDDAAKSAFETDLGSAIQSITGVGDNSSAVGQNLIDIYLATDAAKDSDGNDATFSVIKKSIVDAFESGDTEITRLITDDVKEMVEDNLGNLTGNDDTDLVELLKTYINQKLDFDSSVAGVTNPSLSELKLNIISLHLDSNIDLDTFEKVTEIGEAIKDVDISSISFNNLDEDTVIDNVLDELGLLDIDGNTLQTLLTPRIKEALIDFQESINLGTVFIDPSKINENLKSFFDKTASIITEVADKIFTKPDGTVITNEVVVNTINAAVVSELNESLTSTLNNFISELRDVNIDETILNQLSDNINTYLLDEVVLNDSINTNVDESKIITINEVIDQLNLTEYNLLDKSERDVLIDETVQDLITRMGMDEDLSDIPTLNYALVDNSIVTLVNGNAVNLATATSVTIDNNGEYTIENSSFSSLKDSDTLEVQFQYTVNDGELTSESKDVSVKIDLEDRIEAADGDNLANLLENVTDLDSLDINTGDHVLSGLDIADYIALTDDDNTLKIYGDDSDRISLNNEWKQVMLKDSDGNDSSTPYVDHDGFHLFTETSDDQIVKLLIEDKINVDL